MLLHTLTARETINQVLVIAITGTSERFCCLGHEFLSKIIFDKLKDSLGMVGTGTLEPSGQEIMRWLVYSELK